MLTYLNPHRAAMAEWFKLSCV